MKEKNEEGPCSNMPPPSWRLYDNPSFCRGSPRRRRRNCHSRHASTQLEPRATEPDGAAPGWPRIRELKAELELERRLRKKAETLTKTLAWALKEERRRSEGVERELGVLSEENSRVKVGMERLRAEVAEERKMMRVAEVLREGRVHMKMLDAGLVMEERLLQVSKSKLRVEDEDGNERGKEKGSPPPRDAATSHPELELDPWGRGERGFHATKKSSSHPPQQQQVENPHIRRGIVGYVEFPARRLARSRTGGFLAGATKRGKAEMGPQLERQMRQLGVLLKPSGRMGPQPLAPCD